MDMQEPPVEHVDMDAHGSLFERIYKPFIILTIITGIEFAVAFTMSKGPAKVGIFIALTIVKAFYIIAYFMHVKFERVHFIYTVTLPFILIVYLTALLIIEGKYWDEVHKLFN